MTSSTTALFLVAHALLLLAGIAVFGLSLKCYTEVLKEKAQRRRIKEKP